MSAAVQLRNAKAAEASLRNERITRERVDDLEQAVGATAHVIGGLMDFTQMPFLQRLRWLLFGTLPSRPGPAFATMPLGDCTATPKPVD